MQHLENYGFQKQRSTAAAVRKIIAILENARLKGLAAHMLTIDIEKAYDSVPYELIDLMLQKHACPERMRTLIQRAHTNRAIKFRINNKNGQPLTPLRGVAQGSPLSCILFVLCMQPLLRRLQDKPEGLYGRQDDTAYVDDLTLLTRTAEMMECKWAIVKAFEE